jgi:hypothetical protein
MPKVYLLGETGCDHHRIMGIYDSLDKAEVRRQGLLALQDKQLKLTEEWDSAELAFVYQGSERPFRCDVTEEELLKFRERKREFFHNNHDKYFPGALTSQYEEYEYYIKEYEVE